MSPTEVTSIATAAKDVVITHIDGAKGETLKLIHFAGKKYHAAEREVVMFLEREAHNVMGVGDTVIKFGEKVFHVTEDRVLAFLRLHGTVVQEASVPVDSEKPAQPENLQIQEKSADPPNADAAKTSV